MPQRPLTPNGQPVPRPAAPLGAGMAPRLEVPQEQPVEVVEKLALDEVHMDELLQHVITSKGSDLHLAANRPLIHL